MTIEVTIICLVIGSKLSDQCFNEWETNQNQSHPTRVIFPANNFLEILIGSLLVFVIGWSYYFFITFENQYKVLPLLNNHVYDSSPYYIRSTASNWYERN